MGIAHPMRSRMQPIVFLCDHTMICRIALCRASSHESSPIKLCELSHTTTSTCSHDPFFIFCVQTAATVALKIPFGADCHPPKDSERLTKAFETAPLAVGPLEHWPWVYSAGVAHPSLYNLRLEHPSFVLASAVTLAQKMDDTDQQMQMERSSRAGSAIGEMEVEGDDGIIASVRDADMEIHDIEAEGSIEEMRESILQDEDMAAEMLEQEHTLDVREWKSPQDDQISAIQQPEAAMESFHPVQTDISTASTGLKRREMDPTRVQGDTKEGASLESGQLTLEQSVERSTSTGASPPLISTHSAQPSRPNKDDEEHAQTVKERSLGHSSTDTRLGDDPAAVTENELEVISDAPAEEKEAES